MRTCNKLQHAENYFDTFHFTRESMRETKINQKQKKRFCDGFGDFKLNK